ncbi:MAG TPA: hypothetical protein VF811_14010 [Parasulfuritortus sp.]
MVILQNLISGQEEEAEIVSPISEEDINCFLSDWQPVLKSKIDELRISGEYTSAGCRRHNVEDAHWEWPAKMIDRAGQLQWNSYAVRCGGKTQGLMFINLLQRCRHPNQANEHMVYIDLVSTAPWNRPRLVLEPTYKGVGLVLITEAILQSRDEGFGGRIGLHALPGSETVYRDKLRMELLGPDPNYQNLNYFEMTEARAIEFLGS